MKLVNHFPGSRDEPPETYLTPAGDKYMNEKLDELRREVNNLQSYEIHRLIETLNLEEPLLSYTMHLFESEVPAEHFGISLYGETRNMIYNDLSDRYAEHIEEALCNPDDIEELEPREFLDSL